MTEYFANFSEHFTKFNISIAGGQVPIPSVLGVWEIREVPIQTPYITDLLLCELVTITVTPPFSSFLRDAMVRPAGEGRWAKP